MHVGNILLNMVSRVKHIPSDPDDEVPWIDGSKQWIVGGKLHRLDGPAYIGNDGSKAWWVNGKLHRIDGPAVEWAYGGHKAWYINGICISHEVNLWMREQNVTCPFDEPTQMMFIMKFG